MVEFLNRLLSKGYIMKKELMGFIGFVLISASLLLSSGCAEHEYYHTYHHHSREWYDRHHTPPPPEVNFDIHN
jgi:hypothetical protein